MVADSMMVAARCRRLVDEREERVRRWLFLRG